MDDEVSEFGEACVDIGVSTSKWIGNLALKI